MRTIAAAVVLVFSLSLLGAVQTPKQVIRSGPDLKLPLSPAIKAGNFIYVSGTLATDDGGKLVAGDIKAQTRRTLENIARLLKAAGSDLSNAVSVNVYLKNISDFQAMNEVYGPFWPKDPPVRTTVGANLVNADALVEISMIAVPNGAERRIILPAGWMKSPSPYSYGIMSGDTLFLAGLVSRNGKDNSVVEGDMKTQTRTVMENAGAILKASGMSHDQVVSSRVFIAESRMFEEMNAAYRNYFPKNPPARATVAAPLVDPKYLVEITMLAVKGAREAVVPPGGGGSPAQPNPNLSPAIKAGNRLYLSGMLGNTASNKGDAKAQTREALSRIGSALKAAGLTWDNVVDGIVYITEINNFGAMNEAYREVFRKEFPARATVGTGLMNPDGLVEIMFTAAR